MIAWNTLLFIIIRGQPIEHCLRCTITHTHTQSDTAKEAANKNEWSLIRRKTDAIDLTGHTENQRQREIENAANEREEYANRNYYCALLLGVDIGDGNVPFNCVAFLSFLSCRFIVAVAAVYLLSYQCQRTVRSSICIRILLFLLRWGECMPTAGGDANTNRGHSQIVSETLTTQLKDLSLPISTRLFSGTQQWLFFNFS